MPSVAGQLVERHGEKAVLKDLWERVRLGSGRIGFISGPVGSGKTDLLTTVADQAVRGGALVLEAEASRADADVHLGLVRRMFESGPLPDNVRSDGLRLLDRADTEDPQRPDSRAVQQLATALVRLGGDRPVVFALDDVHHSDPGSMAVLLQVARRIRHLPTLMVATGFPTVRHDLTGHYAELHRQPHSIRIRLQLLSRSGTAALVASRFESQPTDQFIEEAFDATGGNPLLLRAVLDDTLAVASGSPRRLVRGEMYTQALIECLHRVDPATRAVAQGIAALGCTAGVEMLSRLAEIPERGIERAVHDLTVCGLMNEGVFRDPVTRTVLFDLTSPEQLTELHGRAADLLHGAGAGSAELARQLVGARAGTQRSWAVPALREAAEHALVDGDMDFARRCLERARQSSADAKTRTAIEVRLANLAWRTMPAAISDHLTRLTTDMEQGRLGYSDLLMTVVYLAWAGQLDRAAGIVESLAAPGVLTEPADREALNAAGQWLIMFSPPLRNRLASAVTSPDSASPRHRDGEDWAGGMSPDDAHLHATSAVTAALIGGTDPCVAVAEATRVLQRYHLSDSTLHPLVYALWALIYADQLDLALSWCERLLTECAGIQAPSWRALLTVVRAEIALRRGDLIAADQHARTALDGMSPQSWGLGIAMPLAILVQAHTAAGRYDEAMSLLEQTVPDALFETVPGLHYRRARGRWYLATGRLHAALEDFLACGEFMERWNLHSPGLVPWRTEAAEVWLALGEPDRARNLVEVQLRRSGVRRDRQRGAMLRVLGSTGESRARVRMLQEAVEILEDSGDRLQLAQALSELSRGHRAVGDIDGARMLVRKAWHVAKSCGAEHLCRELMPGYSERGQTPPREDHEADDVESLTEAEGRVAVLAARGHTNREIATQLYITPSTVEQHLTRIYRKLNVKRRRDLPTRLSAANWWAIA